MRQAALLYQAALVAAPDSESAPEAAFMGAAAFTSAGDPAGAEALLRAFIDGNGTKKERGQSLAQAYRQIAASRELTFDPRGATTTLLEAADNTRLGAGARRDFALDAVRHSFALHESSLLKIARETLARLEPTPEALAEADYLFARQQSADDESEAPLVQYYKANHRSAVARPFIIRAAAQLADGQATSDNQVTWCDRAVSAFDELTAEGHTAELLELAAACAYRNLDIEIAQKFAPLDGQRSYPHRANKLIPVFEEDLKTADAWSKKLEHLRAVYPSPLYTAISWAREASLFDACQRGLDARPVQYLSEADEKLLMRYDLSGEYQEFLDAQPEAKRRREWRATRDRFVAATVPRAVKAYARAVLTGKELNPEHPVIGHSLSRLARFTTTLGNGKLASILEEPDFGYHTDAYLLGWPAKLLLPRPEEFIALPLPAAIIP
ncbi:MAG: hypothetical protein U0271_05845 [Polyangiaceae bacterium]